MFPRTFGDTRKLKRPIKFSCVHACMQQYGGWNKQYQHHSKTLGCDMKFSVYFPPGAEERPVPVSIHCKHSAQLSSASSERLANEALCIVVSL